MSQIFSSLSALSIERQTLLHELLGAQVAAQLLLVQDNNMGK